MAKASIAVRPRSHPGRSYPLGVRPEVSSADARCCRTRARCCRISPRARSPAAIGRRHTHRSPAGSTEAQHHPVGVSPAPPELPSTRRLELISQQCTASTGGRAHPSSPRLPARAYCGATTTSVGAYLPVHKCGDPVTGALGRTGSPVGGSPIQWTLDFRARRVPLGEWAVATNSALRSGKAAAIR